MVPIRASQRREVSGATAVGWAPRLRGAGIVAAVLGALALVASPAEAQVYKYETAEGTVVYTDKLSDLPNERRAHYNRLEEERARQRQELERAIGKEELERREAEAKRQELQRQQLDAEERARRMAAIDQVLEGIRERNKKREASKSAWQTRHKKAKEEVDRLLASFREAQKKWQNLATKADFALLPGQAKERDQARADMKKYEIELDKAIHELEVVLPEDARKAGIPPGWLR